MSSQRFGVTNVNFADTSGVEASGTSRVAQAVRMPV
jgi:hypothetical protein